MVQPTSGSDCIRPSVILWGLISVFFGSWLALPETSRSHAILIDSEPSHGATLKKTPETIVLRFNATLEEAMTRVYLVDKHSVETPLEITDGSTVNQIVVNVPPLFSGVYTVGYKVLARDGHVTEGSIRFTILSH